MNTLRTPQEALWIEQMRSAVKNAHHLRPECKRAAQKLLDLFVNRCWNFKRKLELDDLTITGSYCFTSDSVFTAYLPRGDYWKWNQSREKITLYSGKKPLVTFYKLGTRKLNNQDPPIALPSYKLWAFELSICDLNFVWCESGTKSPRIDSPCYMPDFLKDPCGNQDFCQSPQSEDFLVLLDCSNDMEIDPVEVHLEDLSFLGKFMDHQLAECYGWA